MGLTIGLVANVYNECNALPGWLETHLPFFDDVRVMHAGPQGAHSTDGTLELLKKWNVPVEFCAIDDGFGMVRTKTMRMSPCDYVMLLDADERFFPVHRTMTCQGVGTPQSEVDWILQSYDFSGVNLPNWENIARLGDQLVVKDTGVIEQGALLRAAINNFMPDAVCTVRRHWHDFSFRRPTQNWYEHPDLQMRVVRNDPAIYFDPGTRMHERLVGASNVLRLDGAHPFYFDHFHFTFKRMEVAQRAHDVAIYDKIHAGQTPPTPAEFNGLTVEQAPPKAASGDVWELVLRDMVDRRKHGIEKYGVPVQPNNGRDALVDAYQEALDLCVYVRQAIEERK